MDAPRLCASVLFGSAVLGADQVTKAAASSAGIVAHNPAYAFGVIGGPAPALIAGTLLVVLVFLAAVGRLAVRLGVSPLVPALVVGGMLGNALDRVRLGAARDFLRTPWVVVNFADLAVMTGLLALTLCLAVRIRALRGAGVTA